MKPIKQIFCNHEYFFVRNIYGDQINYSGGKRSLWECSKCEKTFGSGFLFPLADSNFQSLEKYRLHQPAQIFPKKHLRRLLISSGLCLSSSIFFAVSGDLLCVPMLLFSCWNYLSFWRREKLRVLDTKKR